MHLVKTFLRIIFLLLPLQILAQLGNLPQGSKDAHFLDRLEIMMQDNPALNFSAIKPFSRKAAVEAALIADSLDRKYPYDYYYHLSACDRYNLESLLMNNREWVTGDKSRFQSRKPIWNAFYKSKADFFLVEENDFFLSVNPVIQQQQSVETGNSQRIFLNTKGLTARGLVGKKVGFDFYLTDNQERPPLFVQQREDEFLSVPGAGFYKSFKTTAYDYFDARGTVYYNASKHFNFQFGYDKNFIGNGYRSLLLSDFGTNNLFLKINTKVWKLDYTNLFMELNPAIRSNPGNLLLPKKYAAMHRLGLNVTRWLNVGVSESIIFGRVNHFEFSYLNPVIFLRSIEQQNGSFDNALIGLDFKANVGHRGQLYGQFLLDEFYLKEIKAGNGWWGNKFGIQGGGKLINAFNINNLDLQGEINLARPYTYSHSDSVANYTHYNQPLAHPSGANFIETIGIINYQPRPKWNTQLKLIYTKLGVDTGGINYGGNIFLKNVTRPYDYGFKLPSGLQSNLLNTSLLVSFEPKQNLFLDGSFQYRKFKVPGRSDLSSNTTLLTLGIRLNMFRREYDY